MRSVFSTYYSGLVLIACVSEHIPEGITTCIQRRVSRDVHNAVSQCKETFGRKGLREEVRDVFIRLNEGHADLPALDRLSNEEMPTLDMLRTLMVFRVIGEVDGPLVVNEKGDRPGMLDAEFLHEIFEVDGFLARVRSCHDLCLTR